MKRLFPFFILLVPVAVFVACSPATLDEAKTVAGVACSYIHALPEASAPASAFPSDSVIVVAPNPGPETSNKPARVEGARAAIPRIDSPCHGSGP